MPNFNLVNEKMLEVNLASDQVYSQKGSMIAYKGTVHFARSFLTGGGIRELAMRQVTEEGLQLMSARGKGRVYYAYHDLYIAPISLQGERLYVESSSLLAFESSLQTGTTFQGNQGGIQGLVRGYVSGQGLFTTTLEGYGDVALMSRGNAIGLDVNPTSPIFVDPNAYLGHKGSLDSQLITDVGWKNIIGQASGESYQLKFAGQGTVYVQAYEREAQS
ncbi:MAG: AIM24 family protein [Cyanobacteriota bacterium]|nr:AIM24 family protein [Cyanobacteriota bacterium]